MNLLSYLSYLFTATFLFYFSFSGFAQLAEDHQVNPDDKTSNNLVLIVKDNDTLEASFIGNHDQKLRANFYNSNYNLILSVAQEHNPDKSPCFVVNISILPPGIYFVEFFMGDYREERRVVKKE